MTITKKTDDLKIASMKELIEPITVIKEIPMSEKATKTVLNAREEIVKIIRNCKNNYKTRQKTISCCRSLFYT